MRTKSRKPKKKAVGRDTGTITAAQFREQLKRAYVAGFEDARRGHVADAWARATVRDEVDAHYLFERLVAEAACPSVTPC